jgi:hypothetical protein
MITDTPPPHPQTPPREFREPNARARASIDAEDAGMDRDPIDLDAVVAERKRKRAAWPGVLEPAAVAGAKAAAELVEEWNARYLVGQPVRYWTGFRDGPLAQEPKRSRTRTLAQVLGGHTAVVWMDGESSCVALSHVDPITEDELEGARPSE